MNLFQPTAIVLPHHNLVQSTRQQFLKEIAASRPMTNQIVLIGPDHFSPNQQTINISDQEWRLSTGVLKFFDFNLNLPVNNRLLKGDHAIYNPLTDLKTYFPDASVYPILIGQQVDPQKIDFLINQISQKCLSDCLLVASVDFSHYLPATLAEAHDAHSLSVLQNQDLSKITSLEVDSPQSLYFLTKFAQLKNSHKWNLFAHTNSGFLLHHPDAETTTHIFGSYSFGFSAKSTVTTSVSLPYLLERSQNQTTLGDRFFYGTDKFITDSGSSFVISTITTPSQTIKSFLPLNGNQFIKGYEKQQLIKKYFDSIPSSPNLTKDYFWGKLIYETN